MKELMISPVMVFIRKIVSLSASTAHRSPSPHASPVMFTPGDSIVCRTAKVSVLELSELELLRQAGKIRMAPTRIIPSIFIVFSDIAVSSLWRSLNIVLQNEMLKSVKHNVY